MTLAITHTTPADGTFSVGGAAAWNEDHTLTGVAEVAQGGTGLTSVTAGQILYGAGTSALATSANLTYSTQLNVNGIAINGASVTGQLDILKPDNSDNTIAKFLANNQTAGVEIRWSGMYATGSNTDVDLTLSAKGTTGNLVLASGAAAALKFGSAGQVYQFSNSINGQYGLNSRQPLYINYFGYNGGTSQFRDTIFADGKSNELLKFNVNSPVALHPVTDEGVALGTDTASFKDLYLGNGVDATAGAAATINKATGRFRVSTGTTAFTLTNDHIAAGDTVICQPCQSNATGRVDSVVPAGGSCVINLTAPTVAAMDCTFLVIKN